MTSVGAPPTIEGYRVLGPLGSGAMGSVWRAIDRQGREVAVKLSDRAQRVSDAKRDELFRREALVALNLRHPNLVRGLEVGSTDDGRPFLAMELVRGETLAQRMAAGGPVPEAELVAIGAAVAGALEHAHARDLVHRDVKPENIMLRADGPPSLIDFSLVTERAHGETNCGTPGYASPEMIRKQPVGPAADLFALGVTLASAAVGRPWFTGPDAKSVLRATLAHAVQLPTSVGGRPLSAGFRAVVARLADRDLTRRYPTAGEARLDLEALAHGERPLGAFLGGARPRRWRNRNVLWVATAAVAVLGSATWWLRSDTPDRPQRPSSPPPGPSTEVVPAPVAVDPGEAETRAVLLYVEAHPDEYRAGAKLVRERLARETSPERRAALETADAAIEARRTRSAERELEARMAEARAFLARGDLDAMARVLEQWPTELDGTAPAETARREAAARRDEARRADDATREACEVALRELTASPSSLEAGRRALASMDALLGRPSVAPDRRHAHEELRARLAARLDELAAADKELTERREWSEALSAARAGDAAAVRRVLERRAATPGAPWASQAATVLERARVADAVLAAEARAAQGRVIASVVDGTVVVGPAAPTLTPRDVFGPCPAWIGSESGDDVTTLDLRAVIPDGERAAAWLLANGWVDAAARTVARGGELDALLRSAGDLPPRPPVPIDGLWAHLARRVPLATRPPHGPVPPVAEDADAVVRAWASALAGRRPAPPRTTGSRAGERARTAFLRDDFGGAWSELETASGVSPDDAEVALLRARVLAVLLPRRPSSSIAFLAFCEARRAWDLDPTLPAAPRLVADLGLVFADRFPGGLARAIAPVALAAAEDAIEHGQGTPAIVVYVATAWLDGGRQREALVLLRRETTDAATDGLLWATLGRAEAAAGETLRARRALARAERALGVRMPPWATALLEKLGR